MIWLINKKESMKEVMMEMINQKQEEKDKEIKVNNKNYLICLFLN